MIEERSFFDLAGAPTVQKNTMLKSPPAGMQMGYAERSYVRQLAVQQLASILTTPLQNPHQPPGIIANETYVYRVQAYQSGNFVSNYSLPVIVNAVFPVRDPINFRIRPSDTKARPFYVVLNWDTDARSGVTDRWEIERAGVNNYAAAKLNNLNPEDFVSLEYVSFKTVYAESSRFRERTDDQSLDRSSGASSLLSGQHHIVDHDIEFGNSYFYRIRSVSVVGGQRSGWTYRGVKVTDDTFEKKQNVMLTPAERTLLASNLVPLTMKYGFLTPKTALASTSLVVKSFGRP
jgi:hypothetical protein